MSTSLSARTQDASASLVQHVEVTSPFWRNWRDKIVKKVIPYQWSVINDEHKVVTPTDPSGGQDFLQDLDPDWSHAIRNLKAAAGEEDAPFSGMVFQDSDVYKWLEESAYALAYDTENTELRELCDKVVDLIARAQEPDGYLDTPFQIKSGTYRNRKRFTQSQQSHEMYVMGHYIEAGVAYYEVTGNATALEVAEKMADCLDANFGPADEGKIPGADGHPEVELALARLYEVTRERRFLDLARFFIDVRGQDPSFYDKQNEKIGNGSTDIFPQMREWSHEYTLTEKPVRQLETTPAGHAVRVAYLLTGVAQVGRLTGDEELLGVARKLWRDIVRRQMYITGQIGATHDGEAFTYDYDLPNDTMYGESCASVALSFLARQLLETENRGEYADVLEKEIFNGALSGMALDGQHFYYVNPMEADPQASAHNPDRAHVLMHRAEWFTCACCPANIARFVASLDRYLYTVREDSREILAHQFVANNADFLDGVHVEQRSNFPWEGHVEFSVKVPDGAEPVRFLVRIPSWSAGAYALSVNGVESSSLPVNDGFVTIDAVAGTTEISLDLDMSVKFIRSSNRVRHDTGKVAVMRGPVVFCAEEADNEGPLWVYKLNHMDADHATGRFEQAKLEGVETLEVPALKRAQDDEDDVLYHDAALSGDPEQAALTLIPYYAWANREIGQMQVWFDSDL